MKRTYLHAAYLGTIYLFLYCPLFILVVYSFNDTRYSLLWQGFTWHWYQELFGDANLWLATWNSFTLGFASASIATLIGMLTAVSLYRYQFIGKRLLNSLIFILILSPEIVMGA